jgi:glycosyltransferase involved in cell wall biosynthesis
MKANSRKVCIVVQNFYDTDPRVRREAEALVEAGYQVEVLALRSNSRPEKNYALNQVQVHTLPVGKKRGGKWSYIAEYLTFFCLAFFWMAWRTIWHRYDIVQVCTLPDFLVFSTLVPKLFGAKIVLDMHEMMPEFYISKYGTDEKNWLIRLILLQEKASFHFADHVITINEPVCDLFASRGLHPGKATVIMNSADEKLFAVWQNGQKTSSEPGFRIMYHGTLTHIYGLDFAIRALHIACPFIPEAELWIIGDGPEKEPLISLVNQLSLNNRVKFIGSMPQQEIPSWLARCDIGILPTRKDSFLDLSFSNKLPEYIIMNKPVIVSRLRAISYYFSTDALAYFEPENEDHLAAIMIELYQNDTLRCSLAHQAGIEYSPIRWEVMKNRYTCLLNRLIA